MNRFTYFALLLCFLSCSAFSQNQVKKWYFGQNAGLDFMSGTPTILTGAMNTAEGCSSIADALGNLLFYTDGVTIWNQTNATMANGTGLLGNNSTTQSSLIVKQPGNPNIYFVFSNDALGGSNGLRYSTVDMSLSSGQGSVTVLNTLLVTPTTEKLTAVRHCNGIDVWVMAHDVNANNFRAFLISSAGVNPIPAVSTVGTANVGLVGCMKFSPNGKKLALGIYPTAIEIYDFDSNTGIVSNSLSISPAAVYGCEFSPDNTKLYGGSGNTIYQWDLCAGSGTAIAASQFTIAATGTYAMQLATNGKIYVARQSQQTLGVINSPNLQGNSCNYVDLGQSIAPNSSNMGLPNFVTSLLKPAPAPFTFTVSNTFGCQTASFSAVSSATTGCSANSYTLLGQAWNFGDPASGAANTSTLANPGHFFSSVGSYTVRLILFNSCGGGIDTVRQTVLITQPCVSVNSNSITCATLGNATVSVPFGAGPFSYTWTPSGQTGSVATGLSPGTYSVRVFDSGYNLTYTNTVTFVSLTPFTGTINKSPIILCNGAATGTANVTGLSGGSGSQTYSWTNGLQSYTNALASGLTAGIWSVTVRDALTGCAINNTFVLTQPPALSITISASSPTACTGNSILLSGAASGGISGYIYFWVAGPASQNFAVSPTVAGIHTFTLDVLDGNTCSASKTFSVTFIASPSQTLTTNSPVCIGNNLILNSSGGGTSYTWAGPSGFASALPNLTLSPVSAANAGVYNLSVTAANGCTAAASTSIVVNPTPTVSASGSTVCATQVLTLTASSGTNSTFLWLGPQNFTANLQNVAIISPSLAQSGTYTVIATSASGCTNSATTQANVLQAPIVVLALSKGRICAQGINDSPNTLTATAAGASAYTITVPPSMGNTNPSGPSSTISLLPPYPNVGIVTVTLTGSNGICESSVTANFTVIANPTVAVNSYSPVICAGNNFTLTAGGAPNYTWSTASNLLYSTGTVAVVNPTTITSYSVLGENFGCFSEIQTSTVNVKSLPAVVVTPEPSEICPGQTATLTAGGAQTYTWTSPVLPQSQVVMVTPTITSAYTVTGTDAGGCSNTATISVSVKPCTGIAETGGFANLLRVFPNPNNGDFTLESPANLEILFVNSLGQTMRIISLVSGMRQNISVPEVAEGIYFIVAPGQSSGKKIIIAR